MAVDYKRDGFYGQKIRAVGLWDGAIPGPPPSYDLSYHMTNIYELIYRTAGCHARSKSMDVLTRH